MFDFHMHSAVSFDGSSLPTDMARVARDKGIRAICFTDHIETAKGYTDEEYSLAYDGLKYDGVEILLGAEIGLTDTNVSLMNSRVNSRKYDFIIGSLHSVDGVAISNPDLWQSEDIMTIYERYLHFLFRMIKAHTEFDCLGHLTYISKARLNPSKAPLCYKDFPDLFDETLRSLIDSGRGLEINAHFLRQTGEFMPMGDILLRYKELGGEIVTVGSDAHDKSAVGEGCFEAVALLREIFGHVCTFKDRKPIFHKL